MVPPPDEATLRGTPPVAARVIVRSRVVQVGLAVSALLSVATAISLWSYAGAIDEFDRDPTPVSLDEALRLADRVDALTITWSAVFLATGVAWFVWQHQVRRSAEALGAKGFRHRPIGAIGWWFVPIANLFTVPRIMSDLWWSVEPSVRGITRVGDATPSPPRIQMWWGGFVLLQFLTRAVDGNTGSTLRLLAGAELLAAVVAMLALWVVQSFNQRIEQRSRR